MPRINRAGAQGKRRKVLLAFHTTVLAMEVVVQLSTSALVPVPVSPACDD